MTVAELDRMLQHLRAAGVSDGAPVLIQAYGKPAKHRDWTLDVVGGEVVILADLAPRKRRPRQPRETCGCCGGHEFIDATDNHGQPYRGCGRCLIPRV